MLAALFIQGGINALRAPEAHAQAAKPVLDAMAPAVDKAVDVAPIDQRPDDVMLIKIDAGVKIAAGTMLAFGKFPRLAATALAATLVPTTLAAHRFWEETDPQRKQEQQVHFLKNVGMFGGLLIAAADTGGKPSLGWCGRGAAGLAAAQAGAVTGAAADVTGRLTGAAHDAGGKVSGTARQAGGTVAGLAAGLAGLAPAAGAAVSSRASRSGSDLSSRVSELSAEWSRRAAKARRKAEKRGAKLQKAAEKRGAHLRKTAEKRSAQLQKRAAKRIDKAGHGVVDQASKLGHVAVHQAGGLAKDARKRAHALTH
jgi:uncharacterized membrane protein YphA (DoxX/SURF4 family)/Skp family chaperone for outer membrane proteins